MRLNWNYIRSSYLAVFLMKSNNLTNFLKLYSLYFDISMMFTCPLTFNSKWICLASSDKNSRES